MVVRALRQIYGENLPTPKRISIVDSDLTETNPIERTMDTIFLVEWDGSAEFFVLEAQRRPDADKHVTWPYAIAYLALKYGIPARVIVICADVRTSDWARGPFHTGPADRPSQTTYPYVLGPDNTPAITCPTKAAEDVLLTVFSALTHCLTDTAPQILDALESALGTIEVETARVLADFVLVGLPDGPAQTYWRSRMALPTHLFKSAYAQELRAEGEIRGEARGEARGRAQGEARTIIRILDARHIPLSDQARNRILSCTDLAKLDTWADRALEAETIEAVLED
ncbi:hypothetical protein GCM10027589_37690 [Actinocorallia lasiicapitis]